MDERTFNFSYIDRECLEGRFQSILIKAAEADEGLARMSVGTLKRLSVELATNVHNYFVGDPNKGLKRE